MSWLVVFGLVVVAVLAWLDASPADGRALDASPWGSFEDEEPAEGLAREPAVPDDPTVTVVSEEGWEVPDAHRQRLRGRRWWTGGHDGSATMLVAADYAVDRRWNVYEIDDFEPRLIAAIPLEVAPTIHDLLGAENVEDVDSPPSTTGGSARWAQVPRHVDRSLAATAAWVGRNAGIPQR